MMYEKTQPKICVPFLLSLFFIWADWDALIESPLLSKRFDMLAWLREQG